jgi:hypothetical protein
MLSAILFGGALAIDIRRKNGSKKDTHQLRNDSGGDFSQ